MVLLLLALVVLVGSSVGVTCLLDLARPAAAVFVAGLIVAAQMQASVLFCGAVLGSVAPGTLLLVQVAVSLAVVALAVAHVGVDRLPLHHFGSGSSRRRQLGAFAVGDASALEELAPAVPLRSRLVRAGRDHPFHLATFAAVGLLYVWHVGLAVALPAVDYDGLALHGTAIAHWVTSGSFGASGLSPMVDAAPLGPAAISAWVATFTSDLSWVFLTQLGFTLIGAAAVADLAERFGADRWDALLGATVFAGMPVVALQATSGYPDLAAASTVVAAWALWAAVLERGRLVEARLDRADRRDLALIGVALGLAVAARPANLAAAAVLVVVALVVPLVIQRRRQPSAPWSVGVMARSAALLLIPLAVLGSYWYVRNGIDHGNPLYPFGFGPLEGLGSVDRLIVAPNRPDALTEVGGRVAQTATSWLADLSPGSYAVDQRLGGFGPIFPLLLVPVSVVLVMSDRRLVVRATYGLALALLVVVPTPWWSRGTLFLPAVAAAGLGAVATSLAGTRRTALLAATCTLTLVGVGFTVHETVYVSAATHRHVSPLGALDLARERDRHEVTPYDGYRQIDRDWPDATVAVVEGSVPSLRVPMFGGSLQREVVVVPAHDDPAAFARSMRAAGADIALVSGSDELLDAIEDRRGPLVVAAAGADAPSGMVVVAPR